VVGVLRLSGAIGLPGGLRRGLSLDALSGPIERAFAVSRNAAVALAVNSPGGSPVQSALIAKRIRDLAAETKLPVLSFVEDIAASGGYWLACAGDEIYANESSIIGSIGVVSAGFGFADLIQRHGIERRLHAAGERKGMLDPFSPEKPEDVATLKALQTDVHGQFKAMVRARRGERLKGDESLLFNGDIWAGQRAAALGLIDGIGEMRAILRGRFGDKVRLKRIDAGGGWLRRRLQVGGAVDDWAQRLLFAAEERALWSRYGL
jgi:signal peptide peptidase SppA